MITTTVKYSCETCHYSSNKKGNYEKHLLTITFAKHYKPEDPLTIAGLFMHIAWIYRDSGEKEKDKEVKTEPGIEENGGGIDV